MRLTPSQVETIRDTARRCFGQDADVWLFGSRVDDTRRGGDIDLYIETDLDTPEASWDAERRVLGALYMALGEQKIDVVVKRRGDQRQLPIFEVARAQGVHL
jgi:predicted nucleotidyltransferase